MTLLSKSKYIIGLQCPRYLWILEHDKEQLPEVDLMTQFRFDQGHEVGQMAKKWFPKGVDVQEDDFKGNLDETKKLIEEKKIIFEAGVMVDGLYSRADILTPNKDGWDIIEVKSGTEVKEVNVHDVAFQKHVYEKAGLKIRKCFLMHINNEYVKKGEIEVKKLLTNEDITKEVEGEMKGIQDRIKNMKVILASDVPPDSKISKDCATPYTCPVEDCHNFLPEHNIFHLYRINKKKAYELVDSGVHGLEDMPADFKLSDKQGVQMDCHKSGKPYIHKEGIKHFLGSLKEPLYYLDFETFATAVPLFDGTKPYQQIPFQYSLHIEEKSLKHHGFLAGGKKDPRKLFMASLKKSFGPKATLNN